MRIKIFLFAVSVFLFASCGGDDVDCTDTTAINSTISSATNALNAAISTWNSSEQTDDHCKTLDKAYDDYIDAIDDIKDCAADLPGLITSTQSAQAGLPCN